ncbi:hypothetical protein C7974DRAFT_62406 [Boeremia exigua]|uniref:uncharacterized protein n=1 Tax=Boeremia exigua TaxID=749465 RepID=UPI001E8CCBD3|nr:uncharacterized protein C7974DRAFT_62406 [Boeremia exigua]KAH6615293.1 hypothetical protein C7974DRAFT_62406 [Boeremia exigua]
MAWPARLASLARRGSPHSSGLIDAQLSTTASWLTVRIRACLGAPASDPDVSTYASRWCWTHRERRAPWGCLRGWCSTAAADLRACACRAPAMGCEAKVKNFGIQPTRTDTMARQRRSEAAVRFRGLMLHAVLRSYMMPPSGQRRGADVGRVVRLRLHNGRRAAACM